jgi:two-component system osmolarity sensor histidine kinase EnvZ
MILNLHPFKLFKKVLPRSLFGRALLILVTPLILVQIVLSYVFFDRHTDATLRLMASTITGDIKMVTDMIQDGEKFDIVKDLAQRNLRLDIRFIEGKRLQHIGMHRSSWLYGFMGDALDQQLRFPYHLYINNRSIHIDVQIPQGVLHIITPRNRLFSRTTPLVLIWTTASALLLFAVASLFMRNQIRPLSRLAIAAEKFGKGQDVEDFRPEGALEVRKVGYAFTVMRERIRRQIQQRTDMLAGVSHDLRTPLTRMKLQLSLMKPSKNTKNLAEDVEQMRKMVEGFLAFAKGAGDETPQLVNLSAVLEDLILKIQQPPFPIYLDCPQDINVSLKLETFKRCLTNLLLNSKVYAQHVWIRVQMKNNALEITVEDDGPGIPEAEREEVFKPFYRLEGSRNPETGGIGLGLSIARDGVHSHGGQIRLMEAAQGGLKVVIRLPL